VKQLLRSLAVSLSTLALAVPGVAPQVAAARAASTPSVYQCPLAVSQKLGPLRQRANKLHARLTATRKSLRSNVSRLSALDKRYPGRTAPTMAIAREYNALLRQTRRLQADEARLVGAYNRTVAAYNRIIDSSCH
jgi:hypothetical protein